MEKILVSNRLARELYELKSYHNPPAKPVMVLDGVQCIIDVSKLPVRPPPSALALGVPSRAAKHVPHRNVPHHNVPRVPYPSYPQAAAHKIPIDDHAVHTVWEAVRQELVVVSSGEQPTTGAKLAPSGAPLPLPRRLRVALPIRGAAPNPCRLPPSREASDRSLPTLRH